MHRKRNLNLKGILLLTFLATTFLSAAVPVYASGSIVDDYPELSDVADFIGEKNLSVLHLLAFKACNISMESLSFNAGDSGILALTDAGYCMIGDYTTEKCTDVIPIETGCSIGKGSLMIIHRAKGSSLWFAFFKNSTKECIYLEANSTLLKEYLDRENENPAEKYTIHKEFMELPTEKIFVKNVKEQIGADRLLNNPEDWQVKMEDKVFGGNEFTIITIANVPLIPKSISGLLMGRPACSNSTRDFSMACSGVIRVTDSATHLMSGMITRSENGWDSSTSSKVSVLSLAYSANLSCRSSDELFRENNFMILPLFFIKYVTRVSCPCYFIIINRHDACFT